MAWHERLPFFPDTPTFREEGYDVVEAIYRGALGPADMPEDVVQRLAEVFDEVNRRTHEWKEDLGFFVHYMGPDESAELVERLKDEYRQLLGDLGMLAAR